MDSLIQPSDSWLLWAMIFSGVAFSVYLEQRYSWAAKISGPVLALCIAMVLSNFKIMPATTDVPLRDALGNRLLEKDGKIEVVTSSESNEDLEKQGGKLVRQRGVYEVVQQDLVPLALPLLLFRANLIHIVRTTGWLFLAVNIAALGSMVGAIVASALLSPYLDQIADLAGIMTASYVGGAVNFNAVVESYKTSSNLTGPLIVADNFIMAGAFIVLLLIAGSRWMQRWYPHPYTKEAVDSRKLAAEHWRRKEISLLDIVSALAVATAILAAATLTARWTAASVDPESLLGAVAANRFVHITAWSSLVATCCHGWLNKISGADEMGAVLLYTFLFVIGLPAELQLVLRSVPLMFVFCLIIAVGNIVVTLLLGRLFRLDLEHLVLSMNATLGGPPTAAAMAISKGWSELVLPGLLIGIWGYTIGTATGLTVGQMVRRWILNGS
ncbi:MAG: DUF819 family protein [Pirellulales bacterium]|nr:DUF819 family protein [Pirellulales bacterium]